MHNHRVIVVKGLKDPLITSEADKEMLSDKHGQLTKTLQNIQSTVESILGNKNAPLPDYTPLYQHIKK